jgi:DNA end-binding protein Ku
MKTIWKGYLKVSLVSIPVKMYNATSRGRQIKFHMLHDKCNSRIKQKKICPKCEREVGKEEIVKGYEYGKDMYVVVREEEIEKAQKETTDFIEVVKFVDKGQIPAIYYFDSHFLVPDGKTGAESFAVFHKAMVDTGMAAVAKVVLRNKEHLLSVMPYNGSLTAYSLHYPGEVQDVESLPELKELQKEEIDDEGLKMAENLIDHMSGDFVPDEYVDEYSEKLKDIIRAKAEGEEIKVAPKAEKGKVVSFMDALEKSVKRTKKEPKKKMAKAGKKGQRDDKKRKKG